MLWIVSAVAAVLAIVASVLLFLFLRARQSLDRFSEIIDLEDYRDECQAAAKAATVEQARTDAEVKRQHESITALKKQVTQYQQVVQDFKSASELRRHVKELSSFAHGCRTLAEIDKRMKEQQVLIDLQSAFLEELGFAVDAAKGVSDITSQIKEKEEQLVVLNADFREAQLVTFLG